RENGSLLDGEFAGAGVIDLRADDVGGQQVGRELDALERQAERLCQGADSERLGQPGNAFEEEVAAREQPDEQSIKEQPLADEDAGHLGVERLQASTGVFDAAILLGEVGGHGLLGGGGGEFLSGSSMRM